MQFIFLLPVIYIHKLNFYFDFLVKRSKTTCGASQTQVNQGDQQFCERDVVCIFDFLRNKKFASWGPLNIFRRRKDLCASVFNHFF
jgi:hypothetical protein